MTATPSLHALAQLTPGFDANDLSVAAAQDFLARLVQPLQDCETLPLWEALDRVLAEDLISPINVPPHDNSAMDGYALDGAQLQPGVPLRLRVLDTVFAGRPWHGRVASGECLRIMTGASLPAGLDTVVPQELVQRDGQTIALAADLLRPGSNRRRCGEDLQAGSLALAAGARLSPAALGLVASLGLASVRVRRRLKVAYFSTGDEILSLGQPPRAGAIYDSNRFSIGGLLRRLGAEVIDLGLVPDQPALLRQVFLQAAAQADVVITSGGVSGGDADHTKALMQELGEVAFWRIAMRPGRPLAVGRLRAAGQASLLFGLPGNPVAAMVSFLSLVQPALQAMQGLVLPAPIPVPAVLTEAVRKRAGRTEFLRGVVSPAADGQLQARTTGSQGSGVLSSMVAANCLLELPAESGNLEPGDRVNVWLFDGAY